MELGIKQRPQRNAIPTAEPTHPRMQEGAQLHGKDRDSCPGPRRVTRCTISTIPEHIQLEGGARLVWTLEPVIKPSPKACGEGNCRCTPLTVGVLAA